MISHTEYKQTMDSHLQWVIWSQLSYPLPQGGAHSKNNPSYGGTEITRLLSCLLGVFVQGLRNLLTQPHWCTCSNVSPLLRGSLSSKARDLMETSHLKLCVQRTVTLYIMTCYGPPARGSLSAEDWLRHGSLSIAGYHWYFFSFILEVFCFTLGFWTI